MNQNYKIHSAYNPSKEAERFCDTIKSVPKIIVITEPGESYLAYAFQKKFPNAKLIAIRYTDNEFLESDKLWNSVWRPINGNLPFFLINNIPDEFLLSTIFLPWKPAEKIWPNISTFIWKEISSAIKMIQSIIATRSFFGLRWHKNIIKNFLFTEHIINYEFDVKDSLFIAAGPSINSTLKEIKKYANKKFILAASSATPAILARNIKPNLTISTDGGFWAGNHLKNFSKDIPVIFPLEANIPFKILKNNPCILLNYSSFLETYFFENSKIPYKIGKRNGTVSGTATDLLLDHTEGNIFITGLDLQGSKGFSHAQPYEGNKSNEKYLNKLNPISNLVACSNFDTRSLKTYASWFSQIPKHKINRIFRIKNSGCEIKNIKVITEKEFILKSRNYDKKKETQNFQLISKKNKKNIILEFYTNIQKQINSGLFFLNLEKNIINSQNNNFKSSIERELCELTCFKKYIKYINTINNIKKENDKKNHLKTKITNDLNSFIDEIKTKVKYETRNS